MAGAPPLVRIVAAELGEGLAGILVGIAADVLIFSTIDDLRLSGTAGRVQIGGVVVLALLWAVNLLVSRPRQLRAFSSAVVVEDASVLEPNEERTRQLRRGCVRVAAFVLLVTLGGAYIAHWPLFGLGVQLILGLGLLHTWRTAIWWERRHSVHLWKPALTAVGRENFRRSPYYATSARARSLTNNG
ncbi:hypothetical protein OHB14_61560 [Streptomyces sp. NBC_01613]|uniref:hypothetical protein n=1 Tax=Streptomyces sp. NBC_01613 TaxID=2975896 RepID=UPI003869EC4E